MKWKLYAVEMAVEYINDGSNTIFRTPLYSKAIAHWFIKIYGENKKTTYKELYKLVMEHKLYAARLFLEMTK